MIVRILLVTALVILLGEVYPTPAGTSEPVAHHVETLCDHGHRLYIAERAYATTVVVVPWGCQ